MEAAACSSGGHFYFAHLQLHPKRIPRVCASARGVADPREFE
jgi:hypothetical protein